MALIGFLKVPENQIERLIEQSVISRYSNRAVSHSIHSSVASYEVGNKDSYVLHLSLMVCSVSGEQPFLQCVC